MHALLMVLSVVLGIAQFVCLVFVLIQIFQHGQTALGIVCTVLLCLGIGYLITFIVGWVNADRWKIRQIMVVWTVAFLGGIFANALAYTVFRA
jgi:hypothetical protein